MKVTRIGVVGSGQIGPDIALYFSKVGHRRGLPVVVHDIVPKALDAGRDKVSKKIAKGAETGAFKPDEADSMIRNITWSSDKEALRGCDLVVEAATERLPIKQSIVADLESLCPATAVLASNSSHLEPERIFDKARLPGRCLVIHYFFPAERNPIVEIVPGRATDPAVADFCMGWYEQIGKIPIRVRSRYGYALDPIFEGVFLAAALCVQEGLATPKQVDAIAQKALGLGVGPFTAMNLTGGNPITQAGLAEYTEKIMPWFRPPRILDEQVASGKPWETAARGETVSFEYAAYEKVSKRLLGAYFGIACEIVEAGLVGVGDLEMGVELALVMRPPFTFMNEAKGAERVREYARLHPGFKVAKNIDTWWRIPFVLREDRDGVAVLTIKRPRNLNALNAEVMTQLDEHLRRIRADASIRAAVVTGFGVKAFVSGADIDMIASAKTADQAVTTSRHFQDVLIRLEKLGKPVVCAMNGLAFGGGHELALACTARVARAGVMPFAAQPEVKLGIIPGAGASQRLPRLIPMDRAAKLLRTGEPISSDEAHQLGLVQKLVQGDVVQPAIELARDLASGKAKAPQMSRGPMPAAASKLPEVDIGALSRKIDSILCRAILEGARLPLEQGLELETRLWAEVFATQDMKIGLENFKKTALKSPAPFVHG